MKKFIYYYITILYLILIAISCSVPQGSTTIEDSKKGFGEQFAAAPQFSPIGGMYAVNQDVTLTTTTPGAVIYYTINGDDPGYGTNLYTTPISIAGDGTNVTIKAIALSNDMSDSPVSSATYQINYSQCAAPQFLPSAGTYSSDQNITLSTSTSGATIYYTTNGDTPDAGSTEYTAPISVAGHGTSKTIKAITIKSGMSDSNISTATFTINYGQCSTPQFSPVAGTYSSDQNITLSTSTTGATIYYTKNGVTPDTGSTEYTGPISVAGHGTNMTIKAIVIKASLDDSDIASAEYNIEYPANSPAITPAGGTYTTPQSVTISTTTPGASIRYTTDNSTPTSEHGIIYSNSITIDSPTTLKAVAYKSGMTDSSVITEIYNITGTVADPVILPSGNVYTSAYMVSITTTTPGATIKYTTDGSDPSTLNGTIYLSSILVSSTTVIKAIAYKTDWINSNVTSETYVFCNNSTLDSVGDVGQYTSIAIDSNDKIHISYIDDTNEKLKYMTNLSGSWVDYEIDSIRDINNENASTSIAIDSNDYVHISYIDLTTHDLKYATNVSGSWVTSTIDTVGGKGSSIAIDSNDKIHISYEAGLALKYATNESGAWVNTTIDSTANVGRTSIKCDSNDKLHISYSDSDTDSILYATNKSGIWVCSIVVTSIDSLSYPVLVVDSMDYIHICYRDWSDSTLRYSTNKSGTWVSSTIDSAQYTGMNPSIAIDSNDKIHISHFKHIGCTLRYTTNRSGTWETFEVDTPGTASGWPGDYSGITVDSNDDIHISHYDYDVSLGEGDLRYTIIF